MSQNGPLRRLQSVQFADKTAISLLCRSRLADSHERDRSDVRRTRLQRIVVAVLVEAIIPPCRSGPRLKHGAQRSEIEPGVCNDAGTARFPYAYEALEPLISAATLRTHHGKHHRAYVDKLNALVSGIDLAGATLETIVRESARRAASEAVMTPLFNNAAQAWNHAFYWRSLRPKGGGEAKGELAELIRVSFGYEARLAEALKAAAATGHFGSGWAWLVLNEDALKVVTTTNADTPIAHGQVPLLVIDVWEHGYYLDLQERRAVYVAGVVDSLIDWEFAGHNLKRTSGGRSAAMSASESSARCGTDLNGIGRALPRASRRCSAGRRNGIAQVTPCANATGAQRTRPP